MSSASFTHTHTQLAHSYQNDVVVRRRWIDNLETKQQQSEMIFFFAFFFLFFLVISERRLDGVCVFHARQRCYHWSSWQSCRWLSLQVRKEKRECNKKFAWQSWKIMTAQWVSTTGSITKVVYGCWQKKKKRKHSGINTSVRNQLLQNWISKVCAAMLQVSKKKKTSPNVGLEPTTLRLRVSCSTDWASRADRSHLC